MCDINTLDFSGKGAANAIGALAVTLNPSKLADMREANADGIIRSAKKYMNELGMSMEQSVLLALGTPATPSQASRVFEIFDEASRMLDERNAAPQPPSEANAAKMLEGAKDSEAWAREKWVSLIAGELEAPGSFSKQTMSILDNLSQKDAELFERLCSVCTGGYCERVGAELEVLPYKSKSREFGREDLNEESMMILTAYGLVDTERFKDATISKERNFAIAIGGKYYIIAAGSNTGKLKIGACILTPFGKELARLCDIGTYPGFKEFVCADVESQGFQFLEVE